MSNKKFNARHGLSVGSTPVDIIDDTGAILVNSASATKLATARTISVSGDAVGSVSFDGTSNADIAVTIQPNSVALGTDTTGNYMLNVSPGTGVSVSHTQGEGSTATVSIGQAVGTTDNVTFNNVTVNGTLTSDDITSTNISVAGNATITGNLTVSGTTTTINSTTIAIADLNLELARNATTAAQANGAGVTVTGPTTAATLTYTSADDRWNFNKNLNVTTVYGALSGNASTASAWQTARSISITGDATWTTTIDGSAAATGALTLANSGVTAGTYGSSTSVPVVTVDAKGRVTGVTTSAISGSLTFTGDVTGTGSTGSSTALTLAASGVTAGSYTYSSITVDAKGRVTSASSGAAPVTTSVAATSPILTSGATGSITLSHATSGVTAGTYNNVTVNSLGHVTSGSNTSYLTSYTETDTLATVTARGATTSTASTFSGGITGALTGTLVSPNGATVVAADSAFPSAGNSFLYTLGLGPSGNDGHIMGMSWANTATVYGAQIWLDTDPTNRMAIRSRNSGGVWNAWSEVLTSGNIGSYAVTSLTDTLATVTGRGATTSTAVTFSGGITGSLNGNLTSASPQLAAASESNSIYVTAPSYTSGQITKPIIFDWYGNYWTIGNVRSGATPSSGFGIGFQSITPTHIFTTTGLTINGNTAIHAGNYSSYALPLSGGTVTGVTTFSNASDTQIILNGAGTSWAGITWTDVGGTDYTWFNGANGTFAFGGGGSNVSGKKVHVHGGMTIGSSYAATSNPTNGLNVEGAIQQTGNQVLHAGNYTSYTSYSSLTASSSMTSYYHDCYAGNGYGVRFWQSDNYKISMGSGSLYVHGAVTDYSIKMQMNDADTARGFTFGRLSYAPVASINSTTGVATFDGGLINYTAGSQGYGTGTTNGPIRVLSPGSAAYATQTSSVTGAIKIRMPSSALYFMAHIGIKVYTYDGQSFDIKCGGHTSGTSWYNTFAYMDTQARGALNVRFSYDASGYFCIFIGETGTTWTYPQVFVTDFNAGYVTNAASRYGSGWDVTFETSSYGTVAATQTVYPQLHASNYSNYAVPLSGGTMSGNLTLNSTTLNLNTSGTAKMLWRGAGSGTPGIGAPFYWNSAQGSIVIEVSDNDTGGVVIDNEGVTVFGAGDTGGVFRVIDEDSYQSLANVTSATCFQVHQGAGGGGYIRGDFTATGNLIAQSDIRLKSDIQPITNALEKVMQMRGVTFVMNNALVLRRNVGVIAQEVEAVLPEAVSENEEGIKAVAYGNMVGLLIEAIKEQQTQIDELKALVQQLVNR